LAPGLAGYFRLREPGGQTATSDLTIHMKTHQTIVFATMSLLTLTLPAFAAYPNGYAYCKLVTTSVAMVGGTSDLTDYPLTVVLTDADLRTVGNGGLVNNVNGYDIGFYPDCSGSGAPLKWEMESYSAASGTIAAHVLRPTLSHTKNDTIGMFFGGAFNSFQSTAAAVWNTNYKGVWHLGDGTTLSAKDSTSNINNGTTANAPPSTSGKIDGAGSFTKSSNQYVVVPNVSSLNPTAAITLSAWIYPTTATNDIGILSKSNSLLSKTGSWSLK
jgi:hypothetical protein